MGGVWFEMVNLRFVKPTLAFVSLLLIVASLFLSMGGVGAASVPAVDQQCSLIGSSYLDGVGVHAPAGQTFIPTQSSIVGFALYLRSDNSVPTSMTANIISNGIAGVNGVEGGLVGSVTFTVPSLFGQPSGSWLQVQFPSGIPVTPGAVYALNLVDNSGGSGIKWDACSAPYGNGCGYAAGQCQANSWGFIEYNGDFSVAFSSTGIGVAQGASGSLNLFVTSMNGFASPVSLTFSAPPGVTASFNGPSNIETSAGGTSSPTLTIFVAGTVAPGTYPFTVRASSGAITHTATLQVIVSPSGSLLASSGVTPDFASQPTPATISLTPDTTKFSTVTLSSINGFNGQVSLAASWIGTAPAGVSVSLPSPVTVPTGGSVTSTLTLTAGNSPATGTYTLLVTAVSGSVSHSTEISITIAATPSVLAPVVVPDFVTQPSPAVMSLAPGTAASATIVLTSVSWFSSSVSLGADWSGVAPSGVAVSLPGPVTVPADGSVSSTLTITADASASTGSYPLTVTATNGIITHSTQVLVTIIGTTAVLAPVFTPPTDFSVSPSTETVSVIPGLNGESSIVVNSLGGFSSPVTFSASWVGNAPTGIGIILPQSVTPPVRGEASSPIEFTTTALASTGTFIVQVTATSGGVSHSTDITLLVNQPTLLLGPILSGAND